MATMTSYAPGNFCWCELATNNATDAKRFYSSLFGWNATDQPIGPDQFYTMLDVGGKSVGALYGMDSAQLERGVPPHWNVYVAVANVDESTSKAESLGGTAVLPPFDVMDVGRMSVVQDPTGAMICLWQPKQHQGADLVGENGAFCWWELLTSDPGKAKAFYTGLFGWETGGGEEYTEWQNGGTSIGGMMKIRPEWGPMPSNWSSYVMVDNVDAAVEKAKGLGAQVYNPPTDIPNTGRFATLADPQGAVISVYTSTAKK